MPLPSEGLESAYRANHIEDVKLFLESRDPNLKFSIYNLSGRPYQMRSQQVKILDCSFAYPQHFKAPLLNSLYQLCEDMYQNLRGDSRNVCAINCMVSFCISTYPTKCIGTHKILFLCTMFNIFIISKMFLEKHINVDQI